MDLRYGDGYGALRVTRGITTWVVAPWWYHMDLLYHRRDPSRYSQRSRIYEYRWAGFCCEGLELWARSQLEGYVRGVEGCGLSEEEVRGLHVSISSASSWG
jgi:hypothetical protein